LFQQHVGELYCPCRSSCPSVLTDPIALKVNRQLHPGNSRRPILSDAELCAYLAAELKVKRLSNATSGSAQTCVAGGGEALMSGIDAASRRRTIYGGFAMATFTVTPLDDSGAGSLRDALAQTDANAGGDTVPFDESLAGKRSNSTAPFR
jgi:hypothetical protein